jgi:hypothetical protein
MATWTTLTGSKTTEGSIRNWLNRGDIPVTTILEEAEAWIYQRLRVREMHADEAFVFDGGEYQEPLPEGFLDPISFKPYAWGGTPLRFEHEDTFRASRDPDGELAEGTPSQWRIVGETAEVNVICADDFGGRLLYYKQPAPLSSGNPTNFLTSRYPTLLRTVCMGKGYEHMKKGQDAVAYLTKAGADIAEAAQTNEMFRRAQYVGS